MKFLVFVLICGVFCESPSVIRDALTESHVLQSKIKSVESGATSAPEGSIKIEILAESGVLGTKPEFSVGAGMTKRPENGDEVVVSVIPKDLSPPGSLVDLPQLDNFSGTFFESGSSFRQNELELESDDLAIETSTDDVIQSTTPHFTEIACTDENMEWNGCGPRCYQTCAFQPRGVGVRKAKAVCENLSTTGCYPGCYCKSGFVRMNEHCILPNDCPTRSCVYANEEYKQCGTPCHLTCDNYGLQTVIESKCPIDICVRGCFCKPGYVRSATGLCVQPTRCPRPLVI